MKKIIFLSSKNPLSTKDWSGIPFFLFNALSRIYEVEYVALPRFKKIKIAGYYFSKIIEKISGSKYAFDYGIVISILYGIVASFKLLGKKQINIIFSPAGLTEIAFIKTRIPIITYGDCSTLQLIGYYPEMMKISSISKLEIRLIEKMALNKTIYSIFSSKWACDFVLKEYGKSSSSISFGSNLENVPAFVRESVKSCKLLLIGVNWQRKGGATALQIQSELLSRGVDSQLTIVGMNPPAQTEIPQSVSIVPSLNKDDQNQKKIFMQLMIDADFFLLPTSADCTPIVVAEAFQFGLPVLATNTGGLPSMVDDGETGFLFEQDDISGYVNRIEDLYHNRDAYLSMSKKCRTQYEKVFNWNSWAESFFEIVNKNSR